MALKERGLDKLPKGSGIPEASIESVLSATSGQVYMLATWQASSGQLFYPTFKYDLSGDVKLDKLREGWRKLTEMHSILRTVFSLTSDIKMPVLQVVLKEGRDNFLVEDEVVSVGYAKQPMVTLRVHHHGDGWRLGLTIHHALYDAVSLPLLVQDFQALLAGT